MRSRHTRTGAVLFAAMVASGLAVNGASASPVHAGPAHASPAQAGPAHPDRPPAHANRPPGPADPRDEFVQRRGHRLMLDGKEFRFAGANNYYLFYKSPTMVDAVLDKARDAGFSVVRTWGSQEVQNPDGSGSVDQPDTDVWFQYWDAEAGRPAYKDGPDGLERLDYVLAKARENGLRLVIPLVNNWNNFGGMDQYVRWNGGGHHDDFYTDERIKGWYKDWISHLLNRTNTITGIKYKDDPTVMTWELANEPRCLSAGAYPRSAGCTADTLVAWADEMSAHIKGIDRKHLVSVGDEGFFCDRPNDAAAHWTVSCGEGVDTVRFTRLKHIDVMSYHLYPESWGVDPDWGVDWIARHNRAARTIGKPAMLGEYGITDKAVRNPVYREWTETVLKTGGAGALYWLLSDKQDDGTLYADYDGHTVYCPSPVCTTLGNFADQITQRKAFFPPSADHDTVVTEFGTAASVQVTANDVAYNRAALLTRTVDLDLDVGGVQSRVASPQGAFAAAADGTVTFTPAAGFVGQARVSYRVTDRLGRTSNEAMLTVIVKPDPTAAVPLLTFEEGTEGFAAGNWDPDLVAKSKVTQTTDFATEGSRGVEVTSPNHWFGVDFSSPVDLSAKAVVKYDLKTGDAGTSSSVVLKTGDGWAWCQGPWEWTNAHTEATIEVDILTELNCEGGAEPDLAKVQGVFLWFSTGTYWIDHVRAE